MKHKFIDTFSTIQCLHSVLRIFGLSCITRDGNRLKHSWSLRKNLFYITIFTIINICSLYIKFCVLDNSSSFTFKDAIQLVYLLGYVQYISDLTFVYKYGRDVYLEYLKMYDHIDRILGMNYYKTINRKVKKVSWIFIISGFFSAIFDYVSWILSSGWLLSSIYGIDYIYLGLGTLSITENIGNMLQIEYRLRVIGDLLEADYGSMSSEVTLVPHQKSLILAVLNSDKCNLILWISRCYLLILDQADHLNNIYGVRLLLTSVIFLITMIMQMNIVIRLILGSLDVVSDWKMLLIISSFIRIVNGVVIVLCAIVRFERCYRQTERILRIIDHMLIYTTLPNTVVQALRGLRELILTRPLSFHAHNFYRLDFTFLVSVTSVTVTYTIILLQNIQ